MVLREATPDDVPAMVALLVAVAPEQTLGLEPPVNQALVGERLRTAIDADDNNGVWVIDDGGRIVGHATAGPRPGGTLALGMALLAEARGRGHGRALIERVIAHARACGVHKLELEVWPDNARAIGLYARCGFVVEGLKRDHYRRRDGTLRSSLIMGLLL